MFWMLLLLNIPIYEYALHPLLSKEQTWELALTAKYLSVAVITQALMFAEKDKPLLYRSLIAVFCITAWVDFAGQLVWDVFTFDSALPVFLLFLIWLVYTARRAYIVQGDMVLGDTVFIMLLRPTTVFAVCKALVGFPCASVCLYTNGTVWSFRAKTSTFDRYRVDERWLSKHIAINTGTNCSEQIIEMLADLVGERRWPGTKCVWAIRHVLARIGKTYKPRLFDYLPGIYAMRIIKGRG